MSDHTSEDNVLVSVIVPVRNEAAFIARNLEAMFNQDYPQDCLEVIVADGMSTDGTQEIIKSLQGQHSNLQLIENPGKIVATGMNAALSIALGGIIVRVDGHTIISPNYVRECVNTIRRSGADNVGGRMDAVGEGRFGQAVAQATSSPFGVGGARFHYSKREEWVDTVYMGAWPRDVFARIGLFDEELVRNQDDEFNFRLLSHGGRILLNPQIKSLYYNRNTVRTLWRQYFQYGYWKVRVMQKHSRQMRPRQFAPPTFVIALLLSLLTAPFLTAGKWMFILVASAYLIANTAASVITAAKGEWRSFPLLPATFATLHLAYGFGFCTGLVVFLNRWGSRSNGSRTEVQSLG
jgi:succinoglycan biosynthesis protein ExoA